MIFAPTAWREETEKWKEQKIKTRRTGGFYEREKQRGEGKQEGAAEKP